jgi:uncharacterized protein (DUF433 family)
VRDTPVVIPYSHRVPPAPDRAIYSLTQAARLLRVKPSTLYNWLDGYERRGVTYPPVIRLNSTQQRTLTWPEFIEAGWLSEYRRGRVPLPKLRAYVDGIRDRFDLLYPLAARKPLHSGRDLVEIADEVGLEPRLRLYVRASDGQYLLSPIGEAFVRKVEFERGEAVRYFPIAGDQRVVLDPYVSFGAPTVSGIRTTLLWDASQGGQNTGRIAREWGVSEDEVAVAVGYENDTRGIAA